MDCIQATQEQSQIFFKETACSLLLKECDFDNTNYIYTNSKIDDLIGYSNVPGISKGVITEICGFPGNGKTQLWYY